MPPDNIPVRRARANEWRALRSLRLRMLTDEPLAFRSTLAEESAIPDEEWEARARRAAQSDEVAQFVAEDSSGQLVGGVVVARDERGVGIFAMWVDPTVRGRGVGGRLLDEAVAWARQSGPRVPIWLQANRRLEPAAKLYESRGFRVTGRAPALPHSPSELIVEMTLLDDSRSAPRGRTSD